MDESLMKHSGAQVKGNKCFTLEQTACHECVLHHCKYSSQVECEFLKGRNHVYPLHVYSYLSHEKIPYMYRINIVQAQ